MQPTAGEPPLDAPAVDAERDELLTRDGAVLPLGRIGDRSVDIVGR